jgi:hypothetical protein
MLLTLIGEAIGVGVTALLSPVLSRFLYGVSRVDPLIEKLFHFRHGKVSPYQYVRQTRCAKPSRVSAFRHVFAGCNGTDQHGRLILKLYISQLTTVRHKNVPAVPAFSTNNNPNPNPSILF